MIRGRLDGPPSIVVPRVSFRKNWLLLKDCQRQSLRRPVAPYLPRPRRLAPVFRPPSLKRRGRNPWFRKSPFLRKRNRAFVVRPARVAVRFWGLCAAAAAPGPGRVPAVASAARPLWAAALRLGPSAARCFSPLPPFPARAPPSRARVARWAVLPSFFLCRCVHPPAPRPLAGGRPPFLHFLQWLRPRLPSLLRRGREAISRKRLGANGYNR